MKTIKAIIIDDEKNAQECLNSLVALYCPQVKIIGIASDIQQGKNLLKKNHPDLVFLDISIGSDTGFDLLECLDSFTFQIIFTTAHSEFAHHAFRVNAIDYLLKPIDPKHLITAVEKAQKITQTFLLEQQLQTLTRSLTPKHPKRITISTVEGFTFLETDHIIRLEGSGNYTTFYLTKNEKTISSKSLRYYENLLPVDCFFRCHQSHMIHLSYVKRVLTKEGHRVELKDGTIVPISRMRREELMEALEGWIANGAKKNYY